MGSRPQEGRAGRVRARLLRRARLPGAGARSGCACRLEVSRLGPVRILWAPRRCPNRIPVFSPHRCINCFFPPKPRLSQFHPNSRQISLSTYSCLQKLKAPLPGWMCGRAGPGSHGPRDTRWGVFCTSGSRRPQAAPTHGSVPTETLCSLTFKLEAAALDQLEAKEKTTGSVKLRSSRIGQKRFHCTLCPGVYTNLRYSGAVRNIHPRPGE